MGRGEWRGTRVTAMFLAVPVFFTSKKFILASAAITLALYLSVLLLMMAGRFTNNPLTPASKAQAATPESIKQSYAAPLKQAQAGNADTAWVHSGFRMLDVRSQSEYDKMHIKGAATAPLDQLQYAVYTPDTTIIVYSDNAQQAQQAAGILSKQKLKKIETLVGPLNELKDKGYQLESTPPPAEQ